MSQVIERFDVSSIPFLIHYAYFVTYEMVFATDEHFCCGIFHVMMI